ncbi:MAG: DUF1698 domain-containing protein [bacterium]|nr:DUF1698 domain-containing protein [bacterium]MDD5756675.1 DUF1698 domain-containing protein [bacterium]
MTMSKEQILAKIKEVPFWGHSIPLGEGIITPGKVMDNLITINRLDLTDDLKGQRVLDIGAWDGFYSFECEKRGAKEVVAIDNLYRMQRADEVQYANLGTKGFQVAKEILQSKVKYVDLDVYDIDSKKLGEFDLVLFLGVLYHLKYPVLALEKIAQVCKKTLVIETAYLKNMTNRPLLEYVQGSTFNQDPTNWHLPTISAIKAMLRDVGFTGFEVLHKTPLHWKDLAKGLLRRDMPVHGRVIIRATK